MYSNFVETQTIRTGYYTVPLDGVQGSLLRSNMLSVRSLNSGGRRIDFSRPVFFSVQRDGNGFYAESKELNIYAYGRNWSELEKDIADEIFAQWTLYANEPDDSMTSDAIRIKNNLRALVVPKESSVSYA